MIYTSYEMIRDCREDKFEGWSHFLKRFVPVIRQFLAHYFPERSADKGLLQRVLLQLHKPESPLFQSVEPGPERAFVSELRQQVLSAVEADLASQEPEIILDLPTLSAALESLTVVEKEVVWFETMRYGKQDVGRMLRMDPQTAENIREKSSELIRGKLDAWKRNLIAENGQQLGRAAVTLATKDCIPAKGFSEIIDGRATWRDRELLERHTVRCWHCINHFCRLWEVKDVLRRSPPLTEEETGLFQKMLGISKKKPSVWSRLSGNI